MNKRALLTGIGGQDGSYLAELLLAKGYEVAGILPPRNHNVRNIAGFRDRLRLFPGDMTDSESLSSAVREVQPDEVYNLAALSFVADSWKMPFTTHDVTAGGFLRILEACRAYAPKAKIYQASSSEMFGNAPPPQSEATPLKPISPYGVAKVAAHLAAHQYRESYGMFVCCGILFNHESPRRGLHFVTQKISRAAARIKQGAENELKLGCLDAKRDWGFAGDYVEAMWLMLQQPQPDDYVVGTGTSHSVREFAELAFNAAGLNVDDWLKHDPALVRPTEPLDLQSNPLKARQNIGWVPKVQLDELASMMVNAWYNRAD